MLQSANPQQFWDEFSDVDPAPSQEFKDLI